MRKPAAALMPMLAAAAESDEIHKVDGQTPLEYMLAVIHDPGADASRRDRMAVAAAPYLHPKIADRSSKKSDRQTAADAAATGQFKSGHAPRLVVNNR